MPPTKRKVNWQKSRFQIASTTRSSRRNSPRWDLPQTTLSPGAISAAAGAAAAGGPSTTVGMSLGDAPSPSQIILHPALTNRSSKRGAWFAVMRFTIPLIILLAILPTAHQSAAQGTPQATEPVVCSDLESLIATPVTSPTIPQSTSGFNRANVVLAAENLVACRNAEEWTILAGLMQPAYRLEQFGSEQIEGIAENMSSLAESGFLRPLDLVAMGEPSISSQFGTVAVTTQEGYVLRREEWQFRQTDDRWLFSEVFPLPPLLATNGVGIPVSLTGSGLETTRTSLVNPGAVILGLTNSTGQPVSFAVFRALGTQSPGDFLAVLRASGADPAFVVGWVVVPSESTSELVLSGLPDGVYTIVAGYDPRSPGTSFDTADVVQISIVS